MSNQCTIDLMSFNTVKIVFKPFFKIVSALFFIFLVFKPFLKRA